MVRPFRTLLESAHRRPIRTSLLLVLACAAAGVALFLGRQVWAGRHLAAARRALERHDFAAARAQLLPCLDFCPRDPQVHLLAARLAWQTGNSEEARQHLVRCEQLGGDYEAVVVEYTLLRVQSGDTAHGESFLIDQVNRGHPDAAVMLEALVQGYTRSYRYLQALQVLDLWRQRQPDNARAWDWHGYCLEHNGSGSASIPSYRRAVELDGDNDDARRHLADRLLHSHDGTAALEQYRVLHERHPDDEAVLLGIARSQLDRGEAAEALRILDGLPPGQKETGTALFVRGQALRQQGRREEALTVLSRAAELQPAEPEVVYALARCLQELGRTREAETQLNRWTELNDSLKRVYDLTRQIQATPQDPDLRYQVGKIYLEHGMEQEGVAWLRSAIQEDPHFRPAHEELARFYERKGNRTLAEQYRQLAQAAGG